MKTVYQRKKQSFNLNNTSVPSFVSADTEKKNTFVANKMQRGNYINLFALDEGSAV